MVRRLTSRRDPAATAIRVLEAKDAEAFRALRLEALRDSPASFTASVEEEEQLSTGDFARLIEPTGASWVLGAFADGDRLVGCIGWYRERGAKIRHRSHLWGMYVEPGSRRQAIARALVDEAVAHAQKVPGLRQLELFVAAGNRAAERLYAAAGFERLAVHPRSLFVGGRYRDETLYVRRL